MLCGRVALSTGLAIWQADSVEMRKLATLVSAAAFVKAQAKRFIAMSREEVGMRLRRRRRACLVRALARAKPRTSSSLRARVQKSPKRARTSPSPRARVPKA